MGVICGDTSAFNIDMNTFENRFNQAVSDGITLENNYYQRGDSIYVIVEGDTWEKALENANKLGGTLATINDEEENDWLVDELWGNDKASSNLTDKGGAVWLGQKLNDTGNYVSVAGEEQLYNFWGPGEYTDGLSKGEEYTIFNLYEGNDSPGRDPGMVSTVANRQFNTPELIERGGTHIFYGLAEIKLNEINDVLD
ncbi:hypothetical protein EW15_1644 [Prochlorococcus sp. MIT 0801]|nr:hypothetical protein EW15_1644 [Prochlorococcus sp. MIT 0801]